MQDKEVRSSTEKTRPRRISGVIILVFIVAGFVVFNYNPPVARVHCTDEILGSKPEVIMLGTWWCSYCYKARHYLTSNNISYCEYDIERSDAGSKLFNQVNGQAIPVLLVDKYVINGFDAARLQQLLDSLREAS